ncbi:MAG: hypothetical protein Ct9H300mP7_0790 [Verrucomicrobiota bacterium]|nr:MAG: hypothetical protein Ct9H300mP7_0790 [Verrucomicrobiota bacterium]
MVAHPFVVLLVDIGNTYTHAAWPKGSGIVADAKFTSDSLALGPNRAADARLLCQASIKRLDGAVFCSVVPGVNLPFKRLYENIGSAPPFSLRRGR